jgi:hypothetical protein
MRIFYFAFLFVILQNSCSPSRFVKPLEKDDNAIGVNIGGPLIGFAGTTIPIPFTAITYGRGLSDKTTGFASLHTTSLIFGTMQMELGLVKEILPTSKDNKLIPGITFTKTANLLKGFYGGGFKYYPQIDLNAYWNFNNDKNFFYTGISNWIELSRLRAHNIEQPHRWLLSPHIGVSGQNKKYNGQIEIKWLVPYISNENIVVDYRSFGNRGAIGIYYSLTRRF